MNHTSHQILSEIALKVVSELDIIEGLKEIRQILESEMPVEELVMLSMNQSVDELKILIRVGCNAAFENDNLSSFLLRSPDEIAVRNRLQQQAPGPLIYRRDTLENELKTTLDNYLVDAGLPPGADLLLLFDNRNHMGLILTARQEEKFSNDHVKLLEDLKTPLEIAMSNALRYSKATRMRDALADDNLLFREATVRLAGASNILDAFRNTLTFLHTEVHLKQIFLVTMNEDVSDQRLLLKVDSSGGLEESRELRRLGENFLKDTEGIKKHLADQLPDVFIGDLKEPIWIKKLEDFGLLQNLPELGIMPDTTTIILGVKDILSGFLFTFDMAQPPERCKHIIETLKEPFIISLKNAIRFYALEEHRNRLAEENQALLNEIQQDTGNRVVGMNDGLRHVMTLATQVAAKPSPVLLLGETGTGKEVIATAIHRISERSSGPFISLNCGAIPETLVDSELFGHEKGAFTGAKERKRGRFERASGGTLFLDEIGELPPSAQVKLLRVLQEKEFERVGGSQIIRADVRLIAATHRDLPQMVRDGQFREDLFFRLNVFPIHIPPLRQRREDIPALTYFFVENKARQLNLSFRPSLSSAEMDKLIQYEWPGNVRELQNAIERALILSRGEPLQFPFIRNVVLEKEARPNVVSDDKAHENDAFLSYDESQKAYLEKLLKRTKGKIAGPGGAAELSGLNPSTLRSKIKKYKLTASHPD